MARKVADSGTLAVDVNAWLEELVALGRRNDEGSTAVELADSARCSVKLMLVRLRHAKAMGRLEVGFRSTSRLDGRALQVPVYRVLPPPKGKRR